ncbi:hypothetical protein [Streptacidiphilus neutrinimicus]|uniref:hypothetical protein n=1 Tax=Streptacidiphilus neutrinimicus TaxID=105420 RepID=UPI0005A8053C|nr:hypothetical protein [Streptacidiphilus neutrinimicus]
MGAHEDLLSARFAVLLVAVTGHRPPKAPAKPVATGAASATGLLGETGRLSAVGGPSETGEITQILPAGTTAVTSTAAAPAATPPAATPLDVTV